MPVMFCRIICLVWSKCSGKRQFSSSRDSHERQDTSLTSFQSTASVQHLDRGITAINLKAIIKLTQKLMNRYLYTRFFSSFSMGSTAGTFTGLRGSSRKRLFPSQPHSDDQYIITLGYQTTSIRAWHLVGRVRAGNRCGFFAAGQDNQQQGSGREKLPGSVTKHL